MNASAGAWTHHPLQARLVGGISAVTWRDVAASDLAATEAGPVVLVANHFGGAADAIVLMDVLPRRPRILADDTIWRYPVARQVMDWLGAIPVHRGRSAHGGDAHSGVDNTDMFASCHEALARGESVLIFPEGITRDEPSIGTVRSGAARIALGARGTGVEGVSIVPVGIHYDDKAAFRSSVYVRQGEPIDLDAVVAEATEAAGLPEGREAVDALTGLIEQRLRSSAPDYEDWREARALQTAAEAFLRTLEPDRAVPIGLRDRLSGWLATRPGHASAEMAGAEYREALTHAGVTDTWAVEGAGGWRWRSLLTLAAWIVMLPYAAIGAVVHALPLALTWLVTRIRLAPAVMATVMPVAAASFFGIVLGVWLVLGYKVSQWAGVAAFAVLYPTTFAALLLVTERAALWWRGLRNRLFSLRRGATEGLDRRRERVVSAVTVEVLGTLDDQASGAPS